MNDEDKNMILKNLEQLSKNIKLRHLEDELISQKVLTVTILSAIKREHKEQEAVTKEVLKRITTRGNHAYEKLIACLLKTKHTEAAKILNPKLDIFQRDVGDYSDGIYSPDVTKASIFYRNPPYNVYKMEEYPRGGALIISNTKFELNAPNRNGGEIDEKNVESLFYKLGFDVHPKRNLKCDEMRNALIKFAKDETQIHANASIVVIMSHGDPKGILGVDHIALPESEVFSIFNAQNSPNLNGKPKLFFVQACRGDLKDEPDSIVKIELRVPLYSHMKACFSTCQDMVAWRSPEHGSWFINALVEVFSQKAASTELDAMLKEVAWKINQKENQRHAKQSVDIRGYGWDRDFYFNPGFYIR